MVAGESPGRSRGHWIFCPSHGIPGRVIPNSVFPRVFLSARVLKSSICRILVILLSPTIHLRQRNLFQTLMKTRCETADSKAQILLSMPVFGVFCFAGNEDIQSLIDPARTSPHLLAFGCEMACRRRIGLGVPSWDSQVASSLKSWP
jgi:hypothetical protein